MKDRIRFIKDFPQKGINFADITPLLLNPTDFSEITGFLLSKSAKADLIVAPEARGFIFASPVACNLNKPLLMLRKKGKLPDDGTQISFSAQKEYGSSEFCVNQSDLDLLKQKGAIRITIIDDILATGYTTLSIAQFFKSKGFIINSVLNVLELTELNGSQILSDKGFESFSYIKI